MIPRMNQLANLIRNIERSIFQIFGLPQRDIALAYVGQKNTPLPAKFSLKDIIGDGFLYAVPKFRRTIEKRWKRKFGHPEYVWKMLVPKTNLKVCENCGHYHERGVLCAHCYKRVEEETKAIQEKMEEGMYLKPIEKDVVVLYNNETAPEMPKEFWKGKRIIEMKKERPQWFSKNLLQKTTQQLSESTDVKPTDLA